ncbi:Crotonobetaine/carnitine--CoA ligase [Paraburkholderia aspalathi]|uniref:AMP-binding protein n=1 Tax=Paraburkholderia aspalathi TaxID=1324617 RepID=UPI001B025369|nr:AMP-binding protein [Paraburkholderia aspalathi]CAE6794194.1 Crotonobetaine/carnitine--CoA ligase [Paraburkholderia aspalathi]
MWESNLARLSARLLESAAFRQTIPGAAAQLRDKTAETIRDGWLYTGDLGREDEDGYLFFLARKKDSLRRRGKNVSAWEVENVVNSHPDVEESALLA